VSVKGNEVVGKSAEVVPSKMRRKERKAEAAKEKGISLASERSLEKEREIE